MYNYALNEYGEDKYLQKIRSINSDYFFVALIFIGIFLNSVAMADQRLDIFLRQYGDMKNKPFAYVITHPRNPFYPYLEKHFEEGLDSTDKAELARMLKTGDCWLIDRLLIKGFLQLFPFLEPAFTDKTKGRNLKFMISSQYRAPANYCYATKRLKNLSAHKQSTRWNLANFTPIDMGLELTLKQKRRRNHKPETDRDIISGIQFRLGSTAFCRDYPPAIKTVLAMANKSGGLILTKDEELYLTQRARSYDLFDNFEYRTAVEKIMQGSPLGNDFRHILAVGRQSTLPKIGTVKGFWQPACQKLF